MNKTLALVLVGLVGVGLVVAGLVLPVAPDVPTTVKGDPGTPGKDGKSLVVKIVGDRISVDGLLTPHLTGPKGDPGDSFGSAVGPDQLFPYWNYNGLKLTRVEVPFNQATSTICSIPSPGATSTLWVAPTIQMTSATATNIDVSWGRGLGFEDFATTTLFDRSATTTPYVTFSNNDTAIDDFLHSVKASTTANASEKLGNTEIALPLDRIIFSPNDRFNVAVAAKNVDIVGGAPSETFNLRGSCTAVFAEF